MTFKMRFKIYIISISTHFLQIPQFAMVWVKITNTFWENVITLKKIISIKLMPMKIVRTDLEFTVMVYFLSQKTKTQMTK